MKRNIKQILAASAILILVANVSLSVFRQVNVHAETTTGLTVAPAQLNMTVNAAQPVQEQVITLSNSYNVDVRFGAELKAIDETSAQLVPAGELDSEFAQALHVSASDIIVPAHGTYKLVVRVEKTAEFSPGGHYAVLVLTQTGDASQIPAFRSAIAVNLFVINSDGVKTGLKLVKTELSRTVFSLPSRVTLGFQNDGNTHVVPRASVGIYSSDQRTLYSQAVVNINSQPLFPGKSANYSSTMTQLARRLWPGKLHGIINYRIDGSDIQLIRQFDVWYVPPIDLVFLAVLVVLMWRFRRRLKKLFILTKRMMKTTTQSLITRSKRGGGKKTKLRHSDQHKLVGRLAVQAHQRSALDIVKQYASQVFARALVQKSPEGAQPKPLKIAVTTTEAPKKPKQTIRQAKKPTSRKKPDASTRKKVVKKQSPKRTAKGSK